MTPIASPRCLALSAAPSKMPMARSDRLANLAIVPAMSQGSTDKPKPVATGETDATGVYSIKDVSPGTYTVMAREKRGCRRLAYTTAPVTVDAGKETKVDPITLKAKKA